MTLDEQTVQPEHSRRGPSPRTTDGLLLAGVVIAPCAVLFVALTPGIPSWLHDILLFGPGLVLIVGIMLKVAEWDIAATQAVVRKVGEESGQLAVQVEANNDVLRQLSAAPTVRLEEVRREIRAMQASIEDAIEAAVQVQTNASVERITKALETAFRDELSLARDAFEAGVQIGESKREIAEEKQAAAAAYVDSLGDHPPTLRAVPPPRER